MLHIYYGDGKGKTTAAMGLALRALGHAKHVTILQFLKDGSSGEIALLRRCGADVHACPNAKFTWLMTADEKAEAREHNNAAQSLDVCRMHGYEVFGLSANSSVDKLLAQIAEFHPKYVAVTDPAAFEKLSAALAGQGREVVFTGRNPAAWMLEQADYATEMRAEKHPYSKGVAAREGVEF